jgi:ferredoxin-fold anticodon binding domain-containing protein
MITVVEDRSKTICVEDVKVTENNIVVGLRKTEPKVYILNRDSPEAKSVYWKTLYGEQVLGEFEDETWAIRRFMSSIGDIGVFILENVDDFAGLMATFFTPET